MKLPNPLIWLLCPLLGAPLHAAPRPNILVILADDLGFSDLSCYGGEIPTPNLNALATGGLRFSAFYNSARCCPSRASLMTGLHPHQAGIGSFVTAKPEAGKSPAYTGHLLPNTVTLAEALGDAGYTTWMVGKWHMGIPGPIERGFQNYYGFKSMSAHSESQWDPAAYVRLPQGTTPEISYQNKPFYATDVFADYALEFLRQARDGASAKPKAGSAGSSSPAPAAGHDPAPWFLYLAHSAPHFPIHAPAASIEKHLATYRRGWDVLRAERFDRMKKLGLVPAAATLPPRSKVPVDRDDIANGYAGKENPAWDALPADRREDLARRMATYAAMVEHLDAGIGRITADLEKHHELANTLIFFLSDNGACYEWGPFGFDGTSRNGTTTLHTGDDLAKIGQPGTHSSYGSAWANLCNTPLTLYKHFCHEGGISSPLIVHWPAGIKKPNTWVHDPAHLMDILPTVLDAAKVPPAKARNGNPVQSPEGISLVPTFNGNTLPERALAFEHQDARALRKGEWKISWGKRQTTPPTWELYHLTDDRSEQHNLAAEKPDLVRELAADWESWAKKVGVAYRKPQADK